MRDLSFLSEPKTFYRLSHTDKQPSASLQNVLAQKKKTLGINYLIAMQISYTSINNFFYFTKNLLTHTFLLKLQ